MDDVLSRLLDKAWDRFQETPSDTRFCKTTLSKRLTTALNARHAAHSPTEPPIAAFVPMDGYHHTRAQLDAMPDPVTAHARRGAEFTFRRRGLRAAYLLLPHPPWSHAHPLFSLTIFVSVSTSLARTRLAARHVAAGLAATLAEGDRRAVENDLPNGPEVTRLLRREGVDEVVESTEDGGWAGL
ncbi:hypothetical protein CHGG_07049 [Chaetomium globosum CBS 148.51]|uniref:Uncharacterized protein n=1 Tax=Chaetomium globosum (strain ATCC 6205 / CBS 148.51 / DSM 1962 / NBRC 6347 / NRRL 1970) TaxID=306901 RepID=Q2GYA5_CHAGB|nr:uncharacterized protein CHGG_07049 [Chaetomium globosum CBS 148.51]EAQ85796.1 hypothetical protein CHGG_07049 [Chaetomium globosum CBS 148.51]